MWLMVQMRSKSKMKLSYCDRLYHVWSMTKSKQENNVSDRISLVYAKIKTELSRPIWPSAVCDEN